MAEQKPKAQKPKAKSKVLYWVGAIYVRGAGTYGPGEVVSKEALKAWHDNTKAEIDRFVTSKAPE